MDLSLVKYFFIINSIKLNKMTVFCIRLKFTLPNVIIRGGSGMPGISKLELCVVIVLHSKSLTFVSESSIIDRL